VNPASRRAAGQVRGTDNDDVLGDDRRRMQADLALFRIDGLVVIHLQIDDAIVAERRHRDAGLRVERQHPVAGCDIHDS
jgi:hypothetical protein